MSRTARLNVRRRLFIRLVIATVVVVLAFFRPQLEAWFQDTFGEPVRMADGGDDERAVGTVDEDTSPSPDRSAERPLPTMAGASGDAGSPDADGVQSTGNAVANPRNSEGPRRSGSRESGDEPPPGQLTQIESNVFRSTAGLIYGPGSREGHRLKHILEHARDDPGKPVHGVFLGDRDEILRWIDQAFLKSASGDRDVRRRQQNQRVALTINMHEKIGYVGGQRGRERDRPACRYLRLVIEDDGKTVVTAYPTSSF